MIELTSYLVFLAASVALILVPGPAQALVIATSLDRGPVPLFFLAFLPQFVDPTRGAVLAQFLILGFTMAALDILYELTLVQVVCRLKGRFVHSRRLESMRNRISGVVLILLGLRLAMQER